MRKKAICILVVLLLLLSIGFLAACGDKYEAAATNNPVEMSDSAESSEETITDEEREILHSFVDYSKLEVYYGLDGENIVSDHVGTEMNSWEKLAESLSWERHPDNEVAALDPDAAIILYREDGAVLYLAYSLDYVSVSGGPYENVMVFDAGEDVFCLLYQWAVSQENVEIR